MRAGWHLPAPPSWAQGAVMSDASPHAEAKPGASTASVEVNKAVCRRWIDDFNARDDEAEAGARSVDYVAYAPASIDADPMDSDGWVEMLGVFLTGFPDLQITVEDAAGDENAVAQRVHFEGTHTGVFQGLPPTNKRVSFGGIEFNRMVDGKVAEHWFHLDQVTMMQQLGLTVVPGPRLVPTLLADLVKKPFRRRSSK